MSPRLTGTSWIWLDLPEFRPPHSSPSAFPPCAPFATSPRLTRTGWIWLDLPGFGLLHPSLPVEPHGSCHPLTHSPTHPLTHSPTHPLTLSPVITNSPDQLGLPWITLDLPGFPWIGQSQPDQTANPSQKSAFTLSAFVPLCELFCSLTS